MIIKNPLIIKKAKLQAKTAIPTTSSQTITADSGYDGLSEVDVQAVNSSIDSNIIPINIKKDVTILGVTGTLESGGGIIPDETKPIRLYDYDGTLLYSYTNEEIQALTTLPTPPEHDRLTFQEWNWSLSDLQALTTEMNVGATYTTISGESEFDIELTTVTGLTVTLNMNGTKDWGDGTTPDTATTHTYSSVGTYTIKCNGTPITSSSSAGIFGQKGSAYNYSVINARINDVVTSIKNNDFTGCRSLTSITIPTSVTSIGRAAFSNCYSLTSITIPASVTSIGDYAFVVCYSLTSITIPDGITKIESLNNCYSLISITIPASVTRIGVSVVQNCYSLTSITIPDGITKIESNAFSNCYSITKYDFSTATVVPTLSNTNVFTNINGICKIIVPDALYDEWIVTTNWTTYADYIYKASELS